MVNDKMSILSVRRQEWKYELDPIMSCDIARRLSVLLDTDPVAHSSRYTVRSLYFDTLEDVDYRGKLDGLRLRHKLRLRCYPRPGCELTADDTIKLECKEKDGSYQRKISLAVDMTEARALMNGEYHILLSRGDENATRFYAMLSQGMYRPVSIVEYDRRAFIYPDFHTRITLDEGIRGSLSALDLFRSDLPLMPASDRVTLEVKFDDVLAPAISDILSMYGLFHISAGKYSAVRGL